MFSVSSLFGALTRESISLKLVAPSFWQAAQILGNLSNDGGESFAEHPERTMRRSSILLLSLRLTYRIRATSTQIGSCLEKSLSEWRHSLNRPEMAQKLCRSYFRFVRNSTYSMYFEVCNVSIKG